MKSKLYYRRRYYFDLFVHDRDKKFLKVYWDCSFNTSTDYMRRIRLNLEDMRHATQDKCNVIIGCLYLMQNGQEDD